MCIYTMNAIEREIERLEADKREFPNEAWLYEPDLTILKNKLKEEEKND